ncbi:MAG TPA: nucleoside/nucleotide kinase family protein [Marmoricola sp.]|nr:nucleoside/nucleotide kinase family protein [Marmoricola sp.]
MDELVARARGLIGPGRAVLGICGAPGAGKSTLAARLVGAIGAAAVVVPLDGFHLHDDELERLGRQDRKGAPDTFDVDGYVALLRRIAADTGDTVDAPSFDRDRELALAGAIPVLPSHRLVVTEGNYLLLDRPGWRDVRGLLRECWFLSGDDGTRLERLVARHVRHGRTPDEARAWVLRSDEANARLVAPTRDAADLVVDPAGWMTG